MYVNVFRRSGIGHHQEKTSSGDQNNFWRLTDSCKEKNRWNISSIPTLSLRYPWSRWKGELVNVLKAVNGCFGEGPSYIAMLCGYSEVTWCPVFACCCSLSVSIHARVHALATSLAIVTHFIEVETSALVSSRARITNHLKLSEENYLSITIEWQHLLSWSSLSSRECAGRLINMLFCFFVFLSLSLSNSCPMYRWSRCRKMAVSYPSLGWPLLPIGWTSQARWVCGCVGVWMGVVSGCAVSDEWWWWLFLSRRMQHL